MSERSKFNATREKPIMGKVRNGKAKDKQPRYEGKRENCKGSRPAFSRIFLCDGHAIHNLFLETARQLLATETGIEQDAT